MTRAAARVRADVHPLPRPAGCCAALRSQGDEPVSSRACTSKPAVLWVMLPAVRKCSIAIAVGIFVSAASPAFPCTVSFKPSPESLVERASVIVHARAERQIVPPGASSRVLEVAGLKLNIPSAGLIEFRVLRVLKGPISTGDTIPLIGRLESSDDLNEGPVPYTVVRRGGLMGTCHASNYRLTGDYLLLLNRSAGSGDGSWTAAWSGLSPTNEQLSGPEDPWLTWVAQRVK